ncbi:hypothetical protein SCAR479_09355 [Seiridium cardinale]|uniref:Uncharacterized protein n=1 Tax=Seiridium cardinale TaxID=138064 RepID=A0ABR2XJM5_9PEZI
MASNKKSHSATSSSKKTKTVENSGTKNRISKASTDGSVPQSTAATRGSESWEGAMGRHSTTSTLTNDPGMYDAFYNTCSDPACSHSLCAACVHRLNDDAFRGIGSQFDGDNSFPADINWNIALQQNH